MLKWSLLLLFLSYKPVYRYLFSVPLFSNALSSIYYLEKGYTGYCFAENLASWISSLVIHTFHIGYLPFLSVCRSQNIFFSALTSFIISAPAPATAIYCHRKLFYNSNTKLIELDISFFLSQHPSNCLLKMFI